MSDPVPAAPTIEFGPVLVTGGAGFLGRHLVARLDGMGCRVTVLDDLSCQNSTFDCAQLRPARIAKVRGTVMDRPLVERLVAAHPVVVHFASVVGVEETISRTVSTIDNLNGTMNVVHALTAGHVALFGSSADVYGVHSQLYDRPMREDDCFVYENGRINRWVYAHVKALEENLFSNSAARCAVIRIFNCYGPDMDYPSPKRVVPHFIDSILHGRPLLLSGDGSQRRSLCYVSDMVGGFVAALRHAARQPAPWSDCFNLGFDQPISMRDLADRVIEAGVAAGLLDGPLPVVPGKFVYSQGFDDSWHRTPDITRARQQLGFAPGLGLREGLGLTLAHYARLAGRGVAAPAEAVGPQ